MYNKVRYNGNGVDLNRNYPIQAWVEDGTPYDVGYSGPSAGSEFETKLVMALIQKIQPDVAIDHHNYAKAETQFYVDAYSYSASRLTYQSFVDCCITFQKRLSQYFGSTFNLFRANSNPRASVIGDTGDGQATTPTTAAWFAEKAHIDMAATLEVSQCINYQNGVFVPETLIDNYGSNTFAVADYTFRNLVFRFCEYAMENQSK
jgi:hypothetical protein